MDKLFRVSVHTEIFVEAANADAAEHYAETNLHEYWSCVDFNIFASLVRTPKEIPPDVKREIPFDGDDRTCLEVLMSYYMDPNQLSLLST